ncbi:C40 family peptidase [Streptomyces palmae]|uniref:NlpC/P60 domain-containing protein n=1 Tax=Streptomyces palmae TaxID=1701085 RepID=A0A4Z0H6J0_9ACTN|nr:C40 family peptidase [Streptomyces palmae]TGB08527.1 hypothetical protein E4099_15280 [Streptomyces palmae]
MASHRRPSARSGVGQAARVTAVSAAVSAAAALAACPASAEPAVPGAGAPSAQRTLARLYTQAERATERYNAADERATRLRREVSLLQDEVARGQERVNRMRDALGALAGAQYRSGGVDPGVALLLSADPDSYLDRAATLERIGHQQSGGLHLLRGALHALQRQRAEAGGKLSQLADSRAAAARHKRAVQRRLAAARQVLDALPAAERAAYTLGGAQPVPAPPGLAATEGLSSRGAAALLAARQAVGAPYAWGRSGPGAFDCSGLTQWAYRRAGVEIPRTSQAQRFAGRQVPLSQARPGDLVVYRSDASHVAIYAGRGQVIHAPHPGARVRYDPVGMMPIASVTRP